MLRVDFGSYGKYCEGKRPAVVDFHIVFDNARCYQYDFLVVVARHITTVNGVNLNSILHLAACSGKCAVEGHLAVAMRKLMLYVTETKCDVKCPLVIIAPLEYNGRIGNSSAQLYRIDRYGSELLKWQDALSQRNITRIGYVAEVLYTNVGDEHHIKAFSYFSIVSKGYCRVKHCGSPEGQNNRNQEDCDDGFLFDVEDEDDDGYQQEGQ